MYTDERFLKVHFFHDRKWIEKASRAQTCSEKIQSATKQMAVTFDYGKEEEEDVWVANVHVEDLSGGKDVIRFWYITLDDCSLEVSYHSKNDVPEIDYTYTILNGDGKGGYTHTSAEELGMTKLHMMQIIISSVLLLGIALKLLKAMFSSSGGQIHVALIAVGIALTLDILSNICEMIHATYYNINGTGLYSFDCLASHLEAQCDAIIALVLILVGSGWTLPTDVIMAGAGSNMSMLGTTSLIQKLVIGLRSPSLAFQQLASGNPSTILLFMILISHAILAQWGRTFDDDFDSYHALDHIAGKAVITVRIFLGIIFLLGAASVRNSGRCPPALYPFLLKFQFVGLAWFVSLPCISMVSSSTVVLSDYNKHFVMASGSALVQACSLGSLVWLFCANVSASAYHRFTTVAKDNSMNFADAASSSNYGGGGGRMWNIGKTKIRFD